MKKIINIVLSVLLIFNIYGTTVFAASNDVVADDTISTSISYEDGYVIEVIIRDAEPDETYTPSVSSTTSTNTTTKSKTTYVRDSDGNILWYIVIKATFQYDGNTATCTSCSGAAYANASGWSISSCSTARSGNAGTVTAVAIYTYSGISTKYTRSVSIKCTASGVVS